MKKDLFSGYSYGVSGESVPQRQTNRNFFRSCFKLRYVLLIAIVTCFSGAFAQTVLINPATDGGFEQGSTFAANGWTAINDATNKWVLGGVPAWQTGTNAAYVSNDNGTTWGYTTSSAQRSFFYKDIAFPAGETSITLNLDWRGNGNDGNYDNLMVYVASTAVTPSNVGPTSNGTTTGWTGYTEGTTGYFLLQRNGTTVPTTTTSVSYTLTTAQSTFCAGNTRRLIFVWRNDGSGGTTPPASVDNISLVSSCSGPAAIAATAVTFNSMQANWNALTGATGYNVEYRAVGSSTWTSFTGNPVTGTNAVISGLSAGTTYEYRVSAIGPVCNAPSNIISATPTCSVPTAITIPAATITPTTAVINWTASTSAPASGYEYEVRTSGAAGSGATGLIASGATAAGVTTATVSGLTVGTSHSVYVRSMCSGTASSAWTTAVTFTPTCARPTAVTVPTGTITASGAVINWTEATSPSASGYEYEIRTSGAAGSGATGLIQAGTTAAGVATTTISGLADATTYSVYVRGNCGTGNFSTWTAVVTFTTVCLPTNVPYFQDFESVTTPALPNCTANQNAGTGNNWVTSTTAGQGFGATHLRYIYNSTNAANAWFYTRAINLTAGTSYRISYKYGTSSTSSVEKMKVAYGTSANAASMTNLIEDHTSITVTTAPTYTEDFVPATSGVYYFGFNAYSAANQYSLMVDDIKITLTPTCFVPTAVTVPALTVTATSAVINWTAPTPAPANGYEYEIRTSGAAGSGATGLFLAGTTAAGVVTATVPGLTDATTYSVYVRSNCGPGDASEWTAVTTFATLCLPTDVPYLQDFESVTAPALPICTSVQNSGTGNVWQTATGANNGFTGKYLRYTYNSSNAANTWFYTRAINMTAGTSYRISYNYGSAGYNEKLKVAYGTSADAASMTNLIEDHGTVNTSTALYYQKDFTPTVSGVYYFGFNAYSAANLFYLHVDNILVALSPTCLETGTPVVSAINTTTATLTWTASLSAPASGYEYEVRTSGAAGSGATGLAVSGTTLAGVLTANVSGLTNNTTYSVYVRANCGAGDFSTWTPVVTFATLCKLPTAVTITPVSDVAATISWTEPSPASASGYEYEIRTTGAAGSGATGLFLAGTTAAGVTSASITGLTSGTTYSVYVRGNCGSGDFSAWTTAKTFSVTCVRPTAVTTSAITPTTATISWTASVPAPASGYEYEIRTSGGAGSGATGLFFAGSTAAGVVTADIVGMTTGTAYSVYVRGNCGSGSFSTWTTAVTLTPTCVRPTAVTAIAITPSSATITWTEPTPASASGYEYEVRTSGGAGSGATGLIASGTTLAGVSSAAIPGLVDATTYSIYVRGNCGSSFSTWTTAVTFTTGCKTPTALVASAVTTTTGTITWTNATGAPANGYEYEIRTSGAAGSGATGLFQAGTTAAGVLTVNLTALTPATAYSVYVRAACGAASFSNWTGATALSTLCNIEVAPTVVEMFTNATATSPSYCWSEATGALAPTTTLTVANSKWLASTGFANVGTDKGIKTNLYGTYNDWFISQAIDLGTTVDFRLRYDMAVTSYNGTTAQPTMGTHKVSVVISTDGGTTWSSANTLKTYTGTGTYSNTGQSEIISLAAYTGVIRIGFASTTSTTDLDIDFHIDNVVVEPIPTCSDVLLPVATTTGSSTATFSWTASASAPADGYEYEIRTSGAPGSGATGLVSSGTTAAGVLTTNITALTPNTTYSAYVRANCGSGLLSPWTSGVAFTTLCAPEIAPTVQEGFASYTGAVPAGCWSEATGALTTASVLTMADGKWRSSTGFGNTGTNKAAIINLYGTNNDWMISNQIDLGTSANFRVKYKMAVTVYDGTTAQTTLGTHKVSLVISTDGGTTWSSANTLKSYTGAGTYSNTGQVETVNVNNYTGIVKFAFVAATTSTSPDIHFHIDDFVVEVIPAPVITNFASTVACGQTTALTITGTELAGAAVTIGGTPVTVATNTATQITATIATALTGPIVVTTPGGSATSATNFTFAIAPAMTLSGSAATICAGVASSAITVATGGSDYTTYTWTPATGVTGNETTGWTFNPSVSGTYVLNVSNAAGCINTASVLVTANPLPTALVMTPTSAVVCEGTVSPLAAQSFVPGGSVTLGNGTSTTTANSTGAALGPNPFQNYYGGTKQHILVTAAELTGLGLVAGNRIDTMKIQMAAVNSTVLNNLKVRMQPTALTALTTTMVTTGWTTVYAPSTGYTPVVGYNTLPFTTSYTWNGTSNLLIEISYTNNNGGGGATNTAYYGATSFVSSAFYRVDNSANVDAVATATAVHSSRNNLKFSISKDADVIWSPVTNLYTDAAGTTAYTGGIAGSVYVKGQADQVYTATATSPLGCVNSNTVAVTVPTPTVNAGVDQTVCSGTEVTLTASGTTLTPTWTNSVVDGTAFTPTATATYTVSVTDANGCPASDDVVVTVNTLPTVNAGADQTVCSGTPVTLTASGTTLTPTWDNSVVNGTAFTPTTTATYTVSVTDANSCTGQDAVVVTVNQAPTATATISGDVTITATPAGQTYQWINCVTNTPIAGATSATFTAPANGSYKVTVTNASGCSSTSACVNITKVGLNENNIDLGVALYPNPTEGNVHVTMTAIEQADITVFDAQGKVVSVMSNVKNGAIIDLNKVDKGIYVIKVSNARGSNVFRVVKN